MSVYTEQEVTELTPEELRDIELDLRKRKIALSDIPDGTEKICLMSDLQLDYAKHGYEANAEALGRRLESFA